MAKNFELSIPTPCHENWDGMTKTQKGKFCGSCQKQVIDFSVMSDREIAQFFKKPSTGSVCGRFMNDQLEREIAIPRKRIPWIKYFFQVAIPAMLLSIKSSASGVQKGKVIISQPVKPVCEKPDTLINSAIVGELAIRPQSDTGIIVNGIVTDPNNYPLPGATVQVKGLRRAVAADNYGKFRISAKVGDVLVVTGAGLETTEMVIRGSENLVISVTLMVTGGVEVVAGMVVRKPSKKKVIPLLTQVFKDTVSKYFKVMPNPVPTGSTVQMQINEVEEGYYMNQLIDQSGQVQKQDEIWIDSKARVLEMPLPFLASGNYFIVLVSRKSGKRYSEKLIIH